MHTAQNPSSTPARAPVLRALLLVLWVMTALWTADGGRSAASAQSTVSRPRPMVTGPAVQTSPAAVSESAPGTGASPSDALSPAAPLPRIYRLDAGSTYQAGCFPPCLCPVLIQTPVVGTMQLTELPIARPAGRLFSVTDVNWKITSGGQDTLIRGSGTYEITPSVGPLTVLGQHLILNLRVGDAAPQRFDSGLVPGGGTDPFPAFDLSISINGGFCHDTVIHVVTSPVPPVQVLRYTLDPAASDFIQGCYAPCLCPIFLGQPVTGTFWLVPLTPGPTPFPGLGEFAAVNIAWTITAPAATDAATSRGSGFYSRTGATQTPQQRLLVALTPNIPPTPPTPERRFDSGIVPVSAPWPTVSIAIADNDFYCYNHVFEITATPGR